MPRVGLARRSFVRLHSILLVGAACAFWGCGGDVPSSKVSNTGGSGGGGNGGNLSLGGKPGAGGGTATGGGGAPVVPDNGPHEWLVFASADGIYAYDTSNYPATTTLKLGEPPSAGYTSGSRPRWSRDGTRVMDFSGGALLAWDMSGSTPSAPVTLATDVKPEFTVQAASWSGDGESIAFLEGKTLYCLDSSVPMGTRTAISDSVQLYSFAPAGDGLLYKDSSGINFVRVEAGTPMGTPQFVDELNVNWTWSPTGEYFATEGAHMSLFDARGDTLIRTDVSPLMLMFSVWPRFSPDGSHFSFQAGNGTEALMYGPVAMPGAVAEMPGPTADSRGGAHIWHPSRPALVYNATYAPAHEASTEWLIADLSAADEISPKPVPGIAQPSLWLREGTGLITVNETHTQLGYVDMAAASPAAALFPMQGSTIDNVILSPDDTTLAFTTDSTLQLAVARDPGAPPVTVTPKPGSDDYLYAQWSPSGNYLSFRLNARPDYDTLTLFVARVQGTEVSPLAAVLPTVEGKNLNYEWQPIAE
jgi:hypothetical protein